MKVKEFLVDFKEGELFNIDNLDLGELKEEYINLLNEFFDREVEDREIVLDDLDELDDYVTDFLYSEDVLEKEYEVSDFWKYVYKSTAELI